MSRWNLWVLCLAVACSGRVDRTPPRRYVGLPAAPALPAELTEFDAGTPLSLDALELKVPPECQVVVATQPDRRVLECASQVAMTYPSPWQRVDGAPIWMSGSRSIAESWSKHQGRWRVTQSLHQSKGDHESLDSSSAKASASGPR